MASTAQQTEQQLAKASSVTSLAPKPKGKGAKGVKAKQAAAAATAAAAAKARKGDRKSDRVAWDAQKRRSFDKAPSGRLFANAARLHQVSFICPERL